MRSFLKDMTDFIFVSDQPQEADIIFIPGGSYGAICCTAANLWQRNFAPYILPSGRYSKLSGKFSGPSEEDFLLPFTKDTAKMAFSTEYDYFHALLHQAGIPENAILKENQATFTYENALFSRKVTDRLGMRIRKAILCPQAYHARRCLLYYKVAFPETEFFVCPTVTRDIAEDNWFLDETKPETVLGEIERCGSQFHEIIRQLR